MRNEDGSTNNPLSIDYAHFEQHCAAHPEEAQAVFDSVAGLREALARFRDATAAVGPLAPATLEPEQQQVAVETPHD